MYRDLRVRSDNVVRGTLTRAEWRDLVQSDLVGLAKLRAWLVRELCKHGATRPAAVALAAHLRSLRPQDDMQGVDENFLRRFSLGRCEAGHTPCVHPSLHVGKKTAAGGICLRCDAPYT